MTTVLVSPNETRGVLAPGFARHETFHPRYGWLRKAYLAARDPEVFRRPDATTLLGVGKNMVRAIRYWGLAYKVIEEERSEDNPRLSDVHPSEFGDRLLGERGWDPYLEEPTSLWLLHWQLLRTVPECRAPAWWAIFNSPRSLEFSDRALLGELRRFADERADEFGEIADSSLDKDVRCLLRMYGRVTQGRDLPEDSIDSPFAELDLVRALPGSRKDFAINRGPKRGLPDALVAWACLDFALLQNFPARTVTISNLARSPGSPGRAFALSETALGDALIRYQDVDRHLALTDVAGLKQLVLPDDLQESAASVLEGIYSKAKRR